jgi:hypothetical protein
VRAGLRAALNTERAAELGIQIAGGKKTRAVVQLERRSGNPQAAS